MSLGVASRQGSLLDDIEAFCDRTLPERSIYVLLHRERERLFPDELFADLFSDRGRRSVPPSVVATVMVLQRLEGLSDREAVERYAFDTRWRYAAGVGGYDGGGWTSFAHTVLVDFRARLAASDDPRRIFAVTLDAARDAGLVGAKRVLDSTPLYDAVATMDTVTLIRSAIRSVLKAAESSLEAELSSLIKSGDDYASAAKPQIDWDDERAREALIDAVAKDGRAILAHFDGAHPEGPLAEAATLLATVLGQDLDVDDDGVFRIARRVAPDRVISTVDPETRHGHKTSAKGFDGYKGHAAIDPDSELHCDHRHGRQRRRCCGGSRADRGSHRHRRGGQRHRHRFGQPRGAEHGRGGRGARPGSTEPPGRWWAASGPLGQERRGSPQCSGRSARGTTPCTSNASQGRILPARCSCPEGLR